MNETPDVLTSQQAARLLGLSTTTVQKMVANGELEAWVTSGGHRRIFRSAVENMMPNRVGCRSAPGRPITRVGDAVPKAGTPRAPIGLFGRAERSGGAQQAQLSARRCRLRR